METLDESIQKVREELLGDNQEVKNEFRENFSSEIDCFIENIGNAIYEWRSLDNHIEGDIRKAVCSGFIYVAITNLLLSMKLLIEGHLVASGNLLRQVTECLPMPLLLACRELDIFERFEKDQYSTNRSIQDAIRNASKLNVIKDALEDLKGIQKWYDSYSHPTKRTLAAYTSFEIKSGLYVGANFDGGKKDAYKSEIDLRVSIADGVPNIVRGTLQNLKEI